MHRSLMQRSSQRVKMITLYTNSKTKGFLWAVSIKWIIIIYIFKNVLERKCNDIYTASQQLIPLLIGFFRFFDWSESIGEVRESKSKCEREKEREWEKKVKERQRNWESEKERNKWESTHKRGRKRGGGVKTGVNLFHRHSTKFNVRMHGWMDKTCSCLMA